MNLWRSGHWGSLAATFLICGNVARADMFGSGPNSFQIDFVTIGDAGNAADTTGNPNPAGAVSYEYRIGRYEISEQMIDKANALGGLGITKDSRGPDKPATSISWYEAATFVDWLNTSTGNPPAYKFDTGGDFQLWTPIDAGFNPKNLYRNSLAKYALPSDDEWYKAAYYDPTKGVYYDYPTGSNLVPDGVDFPGDPNFDANYSEKISNEPTDVTNVGRLSPFGTGGQGGNAYEWEETAFDLLNDSTLSARGLRGGAWNVFHGGLLSTERSYDPPDYGDYREGFRVVSVVPEPTLLTILGALLSYIGIFRHRQFSGVNTN